MKQQKNNFRPLFFIAFLCLLLPLCSGSVCAEDRINVQQLGKINSLVKEVMEKSKIPSAAVAIIRGNETEYLSYGFENSEKRIKTSEQSLFQIGSTTKAYTGLGILLLEDEGKLSLSDPVSKYIPWFTATYQGKTVTDEDLTIADCLYQTSGYTNDERKYPSAISGMTLEENIRNLNSRELELAPGKQFSYANANYNLLGLIIETVSGQDYENFMMERILLPLGLTHTEFFSEQIKENSTLVEGSKLSFLNTYSFDTPVIKGLNPSGYLISNSSDMGRWLQIQMGSIEISPQFTRIIEKSHIPNPSSIVDGKTLYASGWFVDQANGVTYHSGGTPNYSTKVEMKASDALAVCVLTNINASANTNDMADNILLILENKETTPYQHDIWYIIDIAFSIVTVVCTFLIVIFIAKLVIVGREIKNNDRKKTPLNRKNVLCNIFPVLLLLITAAVIIVLPAVFKSDWIAMRLWAPVSLYSGVISLSVFSLLFLVATLITSKYPKGMSR